jgi:polysaccharide export outer membrane protein
MKHLLSSIFVLLLFFNSNIEASERKDIYRISPGDEIEISVWKDASLSRQLIVPPDGSISFPLIGDIDANDLSIPELRKIITVKLSEYVPDVSVTVILLRVNGQKAYVIGKVNTPGEFPINMDTNVMQILSMAGGLNPFASEGSISILRQQKNSIIKIPFNYGQVQKGKNLEQNIILRRGDVVVVP